MLPELLNLETLEIDVPPAYSSTPAALEHRITEAKGQGFDVVVADDRTLLLDLDTAVAWKQFHRVLPIIEEHIGVDSIEEWKSKSGNGHVRVNIAVALPQRERYLLQAALGSDGKREALALIQLHHGCKEASILFRPTTERKP